MLALLLEELQHVWTPSLRRVAVSVNVLWDVLFYRPWMFFTM